MKFAHKFYSVTRVGNTYPQKFNSAIVFFFSVSSSHIDISDIAAIATWAIPQLYILSSNLFQEWFSVKGKIPSTRFYKTFKHFLIHYKYWEWASVRVKWRYHITCKTIFRMLIKPSTQHPFTNFLVLKVQTVSIFILTYSTSRCVQSMS